MSNSIFKFSLNDICKQKSKRRLFNIPFPRLETVSPYNKEFTKDQIDMRRKAEVLKYNNNATSTKTNNFTKSQKWSQLVNGNSNSQLSNYPSINLTIINYLGNYSTFTVNYPDLLNTIPTTQYIKDKDGNPNINKNAYQIKGGNGYFYINIIPKGAINNCIKNSLIPTPTSSSDIPGPIMYLLDDDNVPLYNYNKNVNSFSYDSVKNEENRWLLNPVQNIILSIGTFSNLFSLLINETIDKSIYNFSLNVPISIYISGTNLSSGFIANPIKIENLDISINSVFFDVKYNKTSIEFIEQPKITIFTYDTIPLEYYPNSKTYFSRNIQRLNPLHFDVSFSFIENKISSNVYPGTNNLLLDNTDSYMIQRYLGYINISNINLVTKKGYIYDFNLQINMSNINMDQYKLNTYYNGIQTTNGPYIIANVSTTNDISNNVVLYPLPSSPPILNRMILNGV